MVVPHGQVSNDELCRVVRPIEGCDVARASYPDDKVVDLNFDHKTPAQILSPRRMSFIEVSIIERSNHGTIPHLDLIPAGRNSLKDHALMLAHPSTPQGA